MVMLNSIRQNYTLITKSKLEVHSVVPSLCQQKSYNMHVDDWIQLRNTHTVTTHAQKKD